MEPKAKKKKAVASRIWGESPEPSSLGEKYPIIYIRVVTAEVTPQVTRGQVCEVVETIILGNMGVQLLEDSQLSRRLAFTQSRFQT